MGKPINNATVEMLQHLIKDIKANYIKKDDIDFYIQYPSMPTATEKYGGTWEIIEELQGRVLIGSGGEYVFGATGGEATHTLTVDEMPQHTHAINSSQYTGTNTYGVNNQEWGEKNGETEPAGGSQPHNNMPPYIVVNFWKRIALEEMENE